MTTPMDEYGDEHDTDADVNSEDAVVETADEYGPEPEPEPLPAPAEITDQNPGHQEQQ